MSRKISIALLGEFDPTFEPHTATNAAVDHASAQLGLDVNAPWVATDEIDTALFENFHGIWITPGGPYNDLDKLLWAIRYAREHEVPCLATCGGFQHMVLEYARNVLGLQDAHHEEYGEPATCLVIKRLDRTLAGRALELRIATDSRIAAIYGESANRETANGESTVIERYFCNFGINPEYAEQLKGGPMRVTASDSEGEVRAMELPGHPFFIGTLFVPQARSTSEQPHPLISAYLRAVEGAYRA